MEMARFFLGEMLLPTLEVLLTPIPKSDYHSNRTLTRYSRPLRRGHPIIISVESKSSGLLSLFSLLDTDVHNIVLLLEFSEHLSQLISQKCRTKEQ